MHFRFTTSEMTKYYPLENLNLCTCFFQSLPQLTRHSFRRKWTETIFKFCSSSLQTCLSTSFFLLMFSLHYLFFESWRFYLKYLPLQSFLFQIKPPWNLWMNLSLFGVASLFGCFISRSNFKHDTRPLLFL